MELSLFPNLISSQNSLLKAEDLFKIFGQIHNHIYANEGFSKQEAFEEVVKILFIKIVDEKNKNQNFSISPKEFDNILTKNSDINFKKRLSNLFKETKIKFKELFNKSEKLGLKIDTLAYIVNKLQNISLEKSSNNVKGLAFQRFLTSTHKKERGQFFTPEPIVKLCVDMLNPKTNELILDPACGSGGFLSYAIKHILKKNNQINKSDYIKKFIWGIEINPSIARLAKMRLLLEGDGYSSIINTDALSNWDLTNLSINKIKNSSINYKGFFDIIITNPPFGTLGKIKNKQLLSTYNLAYKWKHHGNNWIQTQELQNGQVPEILFIERCLDFLKDNGRMAIVLPNGEFENSSFGFVRQFISNHSIINAVIKLPQATFIPFGTGVKTSILFIQKREAKVNNKVFFSKVSKLGYLGNKNGSATFKRDEYGKIKKDKLGNPILDEDISRVIQDHMVFLKTKSIKNDFSFSVDYTKIIDRLDYDYYQPKYLNLITTLKKHAAKHLGDLVTIVKNKSNKLKNPKLIVNYVELSDINIKYNEINSARQLQVYKLPSRASFELQTKDIITSVAGNSIGTKKHATALVDQQYEGCVCSNGFRIFRNPKIDIYYLLFYLNSRYFLNQIYSYRTGAAIPAISDNDLEKILVYIPRQAQIEKISETIKQAFKLRTKSQKIKEKVNIKIE